MKIIVCKECGIEIEVKNKSRKLYCDSCAKKRDNASKYKYHKNRMNTDNAYKEYHYRYTSEHNKTSGYNKNRHKNMSKEEKDALVLKSKEWHKEKQKTCEDYREKKRHRTNKSRENRRGDKYNYIRQRFNAIKARCKKNNIDFNITYEYLLTLLTDRCPYLDTEFTYDSKKHSIYTGLSIDRILPEKGYTVGNVEFISRKANTMKNDATIDELIVFSINTLSKFVDEAKAKIEMLAPKLLELLKNQTVLNQIGTSQVLEGEVADA